MRIDRVFAPRNLVPTSVALVSTSFFLLLVRHLLLLAWHLFLDRVSSVISGANKDVDGGPFHSDCQPRVSFYHSIYHSIYMPATTFLFDEWVASKMKPYDDL